MKKIFSFTALCLAASVCSAFQGEIKFSHIKSRVEHSIVLSNWKVDDKGVPSFDYAYSQKGSGCKYDVAGRATAGFDASEGEVNLEVYNSEDEKGRKTEAVMLFYDEPVSLALALDEKNQRKFLSFDTVFTADALKKSCVKKSENFSFVFGKTR